MLQRTRVFRGSSVFWGNASLGGRLSHLLEGFNVTQVLPLEPPDAWARRQRDVTTYLRYFRDLVKIFSTERPMNCEWQPAGSGSPPRTAWARGQLCGDSGEKEGDTATRGSSLGVTGAFLQRRELLTRTTRTG